MTYSPSNNFAEENARLLFSLAADFCASGLGAISGFFETESTWCCPSCHRQKQEIARLDKNLNLLCQFHWHHDHLEHLASDKLPLYRELDFKDARPYDSLRSNFRRFPETLICSDCNVAEGAAKMAVDAKPTFSFTPFEISSFIFVLPNEPHKIDRAKAREIYEKLVPSMAVYGATLRNVAKFNADPDGFEPIGGAAWRVLKDVQAKLKAKKQN